MLSGDGIGVVGERGDRGHRPKISSLRQRLSEGTSASTVAS